MNIRTIKVYLKRLGAWATGLKHKYQSDLSFRAQTTVIGLQSLFIGVLFVGITYLLSLASQQAENVALAAFILLATLGIVFGFFITKLVVRPTRRALETQKRFIGDVAHELRTPLSVLKTNTEVLIRTNDIGNEVRNQLNSNIEEIDSIASILNNLLSFNYFARSERIEFENVDLGTVVNRSVQNVRQAARAKNHELVVQKSEFRTGWGNTTALEQVITNLLKNAVTYTPNNGQITVSVQPDYNGFIEITVRDTGIGIERQDLFHIFEPFYRADPSRKKKAGGSSGLGLAIVSEIVKVHNGKVAIRSAPGHGTVASVLIPCGNRYNQRKITNNQPDLFHEISIDFLRNDTTPTSSR